jgi:hypothetical protein
MQVETELKELMLHQSSAFVTFPALLLRRHKQPVLHELTAADWAFTLTVPVLGFVALDEALAFLFSPMQCKLPSVSAARDEDGQPRQKKPRLGSIQSIRWHTGYIGAGELERKSEDKKTRAEIAAARKVKEREACEFQEQYPWATRGVSVAGRRARLRSASS